jgi:hypothetical protein
MFASLSSPQLLLAICLAAVSCACATSSDPHTPSSAAGADARSGSAASRASTEGETASAGTSAHGGAGDSLPRAGTGGRNETSGSAANAGSSSSQPSAAGTHAGSAGNPQPSAAANQAGTGGSSQPSAAGASDPNCPGQLCADFENGTNLDAQGWEVVTTDCNGTGQVSLDPTLAHAGRQSLKVTGAGGYCNHIFARPRSSAFMPGDPLYVRFYARFSNPLSANHVTFLAMRDEQVSMDLRLGGQSQVLIWNRQPDDATLPELSPTGIAASTTPATDRWYCLEFLIDGKAPTLQTWLDGQPLTGLNVDSDPTPDLDRQWLRDTDWHPQLSDVRFGWESYGDDANTLWFDDVVLGNSRSGCDP